MLELTSGQTSGISLKSIVAVLSPGKRGELIAQDYDLELALAAILQTMAVHAELYGAPRLWIALPFVATGGTEWSALHLCRAALELRPDQSVVLLVTDKDLVSDRLPLPPEVLLVALDRYLSAPSSYDRKQALLHKLLRAGQPHTFHNINSEVAWRLIVDKGEYLKKYTRLYVSIFAFQFTHDLRKKIGYAANFLKRAMPHLEGLLSDNQRFLTDAAREFKLSRADTERMAVLYHPSRLLLDKQLQSTPIGQCERQKSVILNQNAKRNHRPQVLWAGRLDSEKRIDLFIDVVRRCQFADFRVFGQVVLDNDANLPAIPNLSYEGPFTSPLEWLDRYKFDAFVFTSRWEGMPNILLEVGALGIPIIAPTLGGVAELIDESTGYPLPEQPNVGDYEQALLKVISDPVQSFARARKLEDLVCKRHNWPCFVRAIAALPYYLPPAGEIAPASVNRKEDSGPMVSVIIPCFNQGQYLEQSVMSALSAFSGSMEIIVVDDGSTDSNIASQLTRAQQLSPSVVRIHRQLNLGLSAARNSGIALARGEYLQFLDADDLLTPGKIDVQVAQLKINHQLDVSVCNYLLCDEACLSFAKNEEAIARFKISKQDFLYRWERGFVIPIHCGLFRRSVLTGSNWFDAHALAKEDWLFWTNLSLAGVSFGYIEGHWAIYRQHKNSMRRSYVNMGLAWLQAGLKINEKVKNEEPLFFESVVSWFEQCYRSNPIYRDEIALLQKEPLQTEKLTEIPITTDESIVQVKRLAGSILEELSSLGHLQAPATMSVIVPVYNHFDYLKNCLCSLANQGDVLFEIIFIDDGSSDQRVSLLMDELRNKHPRLIVHRESINRGISSIQNLAVQMASGEFLAFLDCDDALIPGALEEVGAVLKLSPEIDYLFTDRIDVDDKEEIIRVARYGGYNQMKFSSQDYINEDLLHGMVASHLKVIRKSVYLKVGGYDSKFDGVQDWDLALKVAQNYKFHYLPKPLYRHRLHANSVTQTNTVNQLRKTNLVRRKFLNQQRKEFHSTQFNKVVTGKELPINQRNFIDIWRKGGKITLDLRSGFNIEEINFAREFNAYFDQILWHDPRVSASLMGYLYDEKILGPLKF